MPRDLIPLCQDGDNYYCVEEDGTVVLWDAEEEIAGEESWESVWHWRGMCGWRADPPLPALPRSL